MIEMFLSTTQYSAFTASQTDNVHVNLINTGRETGNLGGWVARTAVPRTAITFNKENMSPITTQGQQ